MRSIGLALTWEFWRRGRGWLLTAMILSCLFAWMLSSGIVESNNIQSPRGRELSNITLSLVFLFLFIFLPHILIIFAEGDLVFNPADMMKRRRLFIMPVSNTSLVAWQMLHGLATVIPLSIISIFIFNLVSRKHGCVLSPISFSLLATTGFCFYYSVNWYSRKNFWVGMVIILLSFIAFFFIKLFLLYSNEFQILKAASSLSIGKLAAMIAVMGLSFLLAVQGVSSFRKGDFISFYKWKENLQDWLSSHPKGFSIKHKRFSSIRSALDWFHSRRDTTRILRLFIIPFILLIYYILILFVGLPEALPAELPIMYTALIFYFLFFPFSLVYEKNAFSLKSFESSLPTTYREHAESILWIKIKTLLAFMMIVLLVFFLTLLSAGYSVNALAILRLHETFLNTGFWSTGINGYAAVLLNFFLALWIFWIVIGVSTSLWLSGRCKVWTFGLFIPGISLLLGFMIWGMLKIPFILGAIVIPGVIFSFYESFKQGLLRKKDIIKNAAIWVGASSAFSFILYLMDKRIFPEAGVMVFTGVALALLPFAVAPMAIYWNRHR